MGNTETSQKIGELEVDRTKGEVHEDWNVSPGKLRNSSVTVFSAVHPPSSRKRPFMEKALQASKVYRHPSILRYLDGGILDNEIIIITEPASPLLVHGLENMSFLQITAGFASIIEALVFLHDKAGVSHNNVSASSIYITSEGIWKLWGFEYLCSFGELTRDHIERINQYCNDKNLPPDAKSRISPAYQHARDCFFFGHLIQDVILPFLDVDEATVVEFVHFIREKALHSEWSERPRLSSFSDHPLFRHEFIQLRHDIANILLLPSDRRDHFIRSLPATLKGYPDRTVASTLGSLIFSHTFFLIPASTLHLMPSLLTPISGKSDLGIFSEEVFKDYLIPLIVHLFTVRDASIRKVLLAHFPHYVHLFDEEQLASRILPHLLLGIRDTDEDLVKSTLHCLAGLIPLLGADVVVGRNREQIFATAKPKTNPKGILRHLDLKKGKESLQPKEIPTIKGEAVSPKHSEGSPADVPKPTNPESLVIPERSSPDGGETTDEDLFVQQKTEAGLKEGSPVEAPSDEQWSDWEEMLDPPMPDFVGVLQVRTPEADSVPPEKSSQSVEQSPRSSVPKSLLELPLNEPPSSLRPAKGSAMRLKVTATAPRPSKKSGLGEEYDIMTIKVEKKRDSELDLFADLTPSLPTQDFNLETMLLEASHRTRRKLPSLSDTLAELDVNSADEGEHWNEEGYWSSSVDLPSIGLHQEVKSDEPTSLVFHPPLEENSLVKSAKELSSRGDEWGQEKWDNF